MKEKFYVLGILGFFLFLYMVGGCTLSSSVVPQSGSVPVKIEIVPDHFVTWPGAKVKFNIYLYDDENNLTSGEVEYIPTKDVSISMKEGTNFEVSETGESITLSIPLLGEISPGVYKLNFRLKDNPSVIKSITVYITSSTSTPTPTPIVVPTVAPTPEESATPESENRNVIRVTNANLINSRKWVSSLSNSGDPLSNRVVNFELSSNPLKKRSAPSYAVVWLLNVLPSLPSQFPPSEIMSQYSLSSSVLPFSYTSLPISITVSFTSNESYVQGSLQGRVPDTWGYYLEAEYHWDCGMSATFQSELFGIDGVGPIFVGGRAITDTPNPYVDFMFYDQGIGFEDGWSTSVDPGTYYYSSDPSIIGPYGLLTLMDYPGATSQWLEADWTPYVPAGSFSSNNTVLSVTVNQWNRSPLNNTFITATVEMDPQSTFMSPTQPDSIENASYVGSINENEYIEDACGNKGFPDWITAPITPK